MKVHTITLGLVEFSEVESGLRGEAKRQGLPALRKLRDELKQRIDNADAENPCDLADERELEEVKFMLFTFLDDEGFVREDIEF